MQAAPKQRSGYRQDQQTTGERVGKQYPGIGHSASLVEVCKCCPCIGFFLLYMSLGVPFPIFRIDAEIGGNQGDAPIFGLFNLAPAPRGHSSGFLLNT